MSIDELAKFFDRTDDFNGTVTLNENLSKHTTMNVGGRAKIFLEPDDEDSLIFSINKMMDEDINFFLLGGGSNVIISDEGLDGVICSRKISEIKFFSENSQKIFDIASGSSWGKVISFSRQNNLGGFEGFTGLSGTVGGALFMNATCFGLSASDNLISVRYYDLSKRKIFEYKKKDDDWGYKKSPFQFGKSHGLTEDSGDFKGDAPLGEGVAANSFAARGRLSPFIILSARFLVHAGFDQDFSKKCLADRKEKGHFLAPSAGSAFKNDSARGIIAGKIIDECGLKGFSVGGASIAPWHGNFIINPERKASARDIKKLSDTVKKIVLEKKGVVLENEILFAGDDFC